MVLTSSSSSSFWSCNCDLWSIRPRNIICSNLQADQRPHNSLVRKSDTGRASNTIVVVFMENTQIILVGGLEHEFYDFPFSNFIIPTDFNSIIFQRGRAKNHQPVDIDITSHQFLISMDWFKGKIAGKSNFSWENLWFPVDFPLNQSIDIFFLWGIASPFFRQIQVSRGNDP